MNKVPVISNSQWRTQDFERGGGGPGTSENLRRTESEIVPPKISPIFCPKLGEEQKKKGLHSNLVRFFAQTWEQAWEKRTKHTLCVSNLMHNFQTGGGACINFAYFSIQFYNPGDPKGGPWHNGPP